MLPRLSRLLWILLLACVFLAFDGERAEAREGLASWYGPGFEGLPTASGEAYDPHGYTAAHKRLPLGTELRVSYGGRSVHVTVNDRGPYVRGRELDLSRGAAQRLGLTREGVDYVEYVHANPRAGNQAGYASYPENTSSAGSEVAPASQATAGGGAYVVQPGDTLSELATQLGTSVEYLASSNGIANPDLIYSGQTIYY